MRAAIWCGIVLLALSAAARSAAAESTADRWEVALAKVQSLIQARTNEVRELRKATDAFVESLDNLARSNVVQLTPEFKHEVALKRLEYYGRLGALNAAAVEMEKTLPNKVAPISRQKVVDMLVRLREELRFTVISLNRVAKSVKDL
jgi:hypothetical protein